MYILVSIIFGVAITIIFYETFYEKKIKKVNTLLAPIAEKAIEASSIKIYIKQKELNRELTDKEKNEIFCECCNKIM